MMMSEPLNFYQIEALRKHMLLSVKDMADLMGVSRTTYYAWIKGKALRPSNEQQVRTLVKALLGVMVEHKWPTPDIIALPHKERVAKLYSLLGK